MYIANHKINHHVRNLQRVKTILGMSRSRMQQPIAGSKRTQTLTRTSFCPLVLDRFLHCGGEREQARKM